MPALGESPAGDGLYQALQPSDSFEEMLVDDMADIHWRLRRMIRREAGAQGKRRRDRKMKEEEIEALFEAGKFHDLMSHIVATLGFVGMGDSPAGDVDPRFKGGRRRPQIGQAERNGNGLE